MILWDDGFFTELDDNRTLVITGRLSSGKTLLAVELAERYLKRGYKLLSQISCAWNDDYSQCVPDDSGRYRTVVIIDEGGLYFRTAKSASVVSSFAAKMDMVLIFSGRKLPHEDLCTLTCQVWFDFFKFFLIPLKLWRYDVYNGNKTYSGYFLQTAWWHYWGIYDTLDPADPPYRLVEWFQAATRAFFARFGRTYTDGISDVASSGGDNIAEPVSELAVAGRRIASAASAISRQSSRWRR